MRVPRRDLVVFVIAIMVLGFAFTIQVRSQATAEKLLSGQDNVTLALLITGLAQSNEQLVLTRSDLTAEAQKLQSAADSNRSGSPALQEQLSQLQVLDGTVPVHGPGVTMTVGFTMQPFELQDLANSMRQLGAEAIAVNGQRLGAKSVIGSRDGNLTVDGNTLNAPYNFQVIGDSAKLTTGAKSVVGTLKARGNVSVDPAPDVHISAVAPRRPDIYSTYQR
ncbi:MAG: DUF881 domain-containing protein [Candidatus Dormiibacterota bacterium]